MKRITVTAKIERRIFELLEESPSGVHWADLNRKIKESEPALHPKTINGTVWKLIEKYPDRVYKPEKGLFKLTKYDKLR